MFYGDTKSNFSEKTKVLLSNSDHNIGEVTANEGITTDTLYADCEVVCSGIIAPEVSFLLETDKNRLMNLREADPTKLSDTDLAIVIETSDNWDCVEEQVREFVKRAELSEEYEEADDVTFEGIIYKAAEILGVEI